MHCSRCRGHVAQVKGADVPANYCEYYCVNCGERFWIERPTQPRPTGQSVNSGLSPQEQLAQIDNSNPQTPNRLSLGHN